MYDGRCGHGRGRRGRCRRGRPGSAWSDGQPGCGGAVRPWAEQSPASPAPCAPGRAAGWAWAWPAASPAACPASRAPRAPRPWPVRRWASRCATSCRPHRAASVAGSCRCRSGCPARRAGPGAGSTTVSSRPLLDGPASRGRLVRTVSHGCHIPLRSRSVSRSVRRHAAHHSDASSPSIVASGSTFSDSALTSGASAGCPRLVAGTLLRRGREPPRSPPRPSPRPIGPRQPPRHPPWASRTSRPSWTGRAPGSSRRSGCGPPDRPG